MLCLRTTEKTEKRSKETVEDKRKVSNVQKTDRSNRKNPVRKWLFSILGGSKIYIVFLTIMQALQGASGVLYALFLRRIVDAAVVHDRAEFFRGLLLTILLVAGQICLRAIIRWLMELSKSTFENLFKERLMDTLLSRDYLCVSAVHSGEWMNRLTNDTVVVANHSVDIIPGLAEMAVKLISALVLIVILEPGFAAILIPGGVVLVLLTLLFRKVLKRMHKKVQEADGRLRIFLQERIGSMLIIRSFAAEAQTRTGTHEKTEEHKAARMKKNRVSNLCNIGFGTAMNGMYLLGVGWCGYGILMGTISFGTLTAITQLITQIQAPFANITGYLPKYYAMLASAERLMEAERFSEDRPDRLSQQEIDRFYAGLLEFGCRDVAFTYLPAAGIADSGFESIDAGSDDKTPTVLKELSFSVKKGEYVAFTGQSGCGKSTALKLLMCVFRPDAGCVFYRDESGTEGVLTAKHRRMFAYVPQGNALMNGSIREVVSFSHPEDAGNDDQLWHALQLACAESFVSELELGLNTVLGERGTGLSEGQMQRLAIARAIFSDAPVLLLDEATSALDTETEKRLLANLREMTDKTVIIVTHRPAVLSICDKALEFSEDGLVEKKAL